MLKTLGSHVRANVVGYIALFVALGGTATAATYVVSSNSQIGPNTVSGHKPPSGDHSNLFLGSVNAQDVAANSLTGASINEASLTGDVQKLVKNLVLGAGPTKIATVGPYEIDGACNGTNATVHILALGPAGTADVMYDQTLNDVTDEGTHSNGLLIPASTDTEFASTGAPVSQYRRIGGTAMLKTNAGVLVEVEFDAVADDRGAGSCFVYGTATRAT